MEVWKKIEEFENYEISNLGRLKVHLKFRRYRDYQTKILNPAKDKDGYFRTILTRKGIRLNKQIHRLVCSSFIDNTLKKPCVNHIDGNKQNNNVTNLEWCTVRENNIHAIKLGLKKPLKGVNHNMVKLTEDEVLQIRKMNITQREISKIYNISQTQVSRIKNNLRWSA
jgi:hypothetical protein